MDPPEDPPKDKKRTRRGKHSAAKKAQKVQKHLQIRARNSKILIETLIEKYTTGFVPISGVETTTSHTQSRRPVVLLTGSTGNLGSEILVTLLKDDRIGKIYAFNRHDDCHTLLERHSMRLKDKGLDVNLLTNDKLVFISGDAEQSDLGLDQGQYSELQNSVNVVIHNAWKLDFNLRLASFEPLIQGTRHILDLIRSGPQASSTHFWFLSSIASAQSWHKSRGPLPEEVVTDASCAAGTGYGKSKYVAERVVAQSGIRSTSIRIGHISGSLPNGAWGTTDWVPMLVKSSIALGVLPGKDVSGHVSWLPMDRVAASVVNVALAAAASREVPSAVLNLVHPRPVEWAEIIGNLQSAIKEVLGQKLGVVSFSDWMSAVEFHVHNEKAGTAEEVPAVRLLDFFRSLARRNDSDLPHNIYLGVAGFIEFGGLAPPSTDKMSMATGDLMGAQPLNQQDVESWIKYWRMVGFLSEAPIRGEEKN